MNTGLSDWTVCGATLLGDHPVNDLRQLELAETESEIVITGVVRSYYLKQMAQEAVRPALAGRRLRNMVVVISRRQATDGVQASDLAEAMPAEDAN